MSLIGRTIRRLRDAAGRLVDREGEGEGAVDAEIPDAKDSASDTEERLTDRLGERLPGSLADVREAAEKGAEGVEDVRELSSDLISRTEERARDVARHASERIRSVWEPEDPDRILEESRLFDPLPVEAERADPDLLSLRWRNEALLALTSAGVLSLEDEIIQHTDRLFHAGAPTPELSERLFGQDYSELHRWIDTVPGSGVSGGGITHRMEHGHDLEAAATIHDEHGLEGVLVWMQHVGQDAFSSTGIPLPAGGEELTGFLVEEGYASRGNAALLVSFNAAELAAGFLAGAFALRLAVQLRNAHRRRKVRERCAAAREARERGDLDAVIDNYAEARSLQDDPALSLALGWAYREIGRPAAESFLEFRRAALGLASEDRTIEIGGVALSLRGLAYLLALVEAPQVLHRDDLAGAWREELNRMVSGAVASFEAAAISQSEPPGVSVGDRDLEWRPRPLSAAANYYLAARAVLAVPFAETAVGLERLRGNALQLLRRAETDSRPDELESVAARWEATLADDVGLASS